MTRTTKMVTKEEVRNTVLILRHLTEGNVSTIDKIDDKRKAEGQDITDLEEVKVAYIEIWHKLNKILAKD